MGSPLWMLTHTHDQWGMRRRTTKMVLDLIATGHPCEVCHGTIEAFRIFEKVQTRDGHEQRDIVTACNRCIAAAANTAEGTDQTPIQVLLHMKAGAAK